MKIECELNPKRVSNVFSIAVCILISVVCTMLISMIAFQLMRVAGFNYIVYSDNRGDYLSIFGVHCSVVFLTTSLMAMLSENNRYVYWVEMITSVLIAPRYFSFLALVIYSISTVVWAMIGLYLNMGFVVIGSFLFGLISVTLLFSRMVAIYYQKDRNKNKIKKYLLKKVEDDEHKKYLLRLKEITFIKAENREFYDVYDNLRLIEDCIIKEWSMKKRDEQQIFHAVGYTEILYVDLLIDLCMMYTQEMLDYIETWANENELIRKLCYLVYPTILNSFLRNNRKDLFNRVLNKWGFIENQHNQIAEYLVHEDEVLKEGVLDEYLARVLNSFNNELKFEGSERYIEEFFCRLYEEQYDLFERVLSYKSNWSSVKI